MYVPDRSRGRRWSGSGVYMLVLLVSVLGGAPCYVDYKVDIGSDNVDGVD
jgi:hypothetical protein